MSAAANVAYLAGLCGIVSFIQALLSRRKEAKREALALKQSTERAPVEIDSIVLGNAREAMILQAGVVTALTAQLASARATTAERDATIVDMKVEIKLYEKRYTELLTRLGEATVKIQDLEKER